MGFRYFIFDSDVNFIVDSHVKIDNHVKEAACKEGETGMSLDDECVRSLRAVLQHYT
jgi:hypothetical protein